MASGTAPEAPVDRVSASAAMGYSRSKLVAEILLDRAARLSRVRSAVCRVGIIAGPVETVAGMWNKHEYIPSVSNARGVGRVKTTHVATTVNGGGDVSKLPY